MPASPSLPLLSILQEWLHYISVLFWWLSGDAPYDVAAGEIIRNRSVTWYEIIPVPAQPWTGEHFWTPKRHLVRDLFGTASETMGEGVFPRGSRQWSEAGRLNVPFLRTFTTSKSRSYHGYGNVERGKVQTAYRASRFLTGRVSSLTCQGRGRWKMPQKINHFARQTE